MADGKSGPSVAAGADLPPGVRRKLSAAIDWDRFEAAMAMLGEVASAEKRPSKAEVERGQAPPPTPPDLPPDYPDRVDKTFTAAAQVIRDGEDRLRRKEYVWFGAAVGLALVPVVLPLFVEALRSDWYRVAAMVIGQGGFLALFFTKVLDYLRGADAANRFIGHARILFDLSFTPAEHHTNMIWFREVAGRWQGLPAAQPLPPAPGAGGS